MKVAATGLSAKLGLVWPHIYTSPCLGWTSSTAASRAFGSPADRVFLDCRGAGIPVCRACRTGPSSLHGKAGRGPRPREREPQPGRPDATGVRGRAPGWPAVGRMPGDGVIRSRRKGASPESSSRPGFGTRSGPRTVAAEPASAFPVAGAQQGAASQHVRALSRRHRRGWRLAAGRACRRPGRPRDPSAAARPFGCMSGAGAMDAHRPRMVPGVDVLIATCSKGEAARRSACRALPCRGLVAAPPDR
jgi:hypothetical protein